MGTRSKLAIIFGIFSLIGLAGILFLFFGDVAVLNPKGIIASKQSRLILISTVLMLLVVVPVFILALIIPWKYRSENRKAEYAPHFWNSHLAEGLWWGIPCVIILILGAITWKSCHELDPFKPLESNVKPVRIQAVALQWKWLFLYPDHKIATVNYVQFPEQTPINFEVTADAPMNSFWIPSLAGQVYAMAGMKSKLHLMADTVGSHRGSSANISGTGFAGMFFVAKSTTAEDFEKWVQSVKRSSSTLSSEQYKQLVAPSQYDPAAFFVLGEADLFDRIIMKYMGNTNASGH